VSIRTAPYD